MLKLVNYKCFFGVLAVYRNDDLLPRALNVVCLTCFHAFEFNSKPCDIKLLDFCKGFGFAPVQWAIVW